METEDKLKLIIEMEDTMDTATHFVIGISIAGLAHITPNLSTEPTISQAILVGTIIGSQAPDFDGITRFIGGNSSYIKNHRGITHSMPAILIWPTLISLLLYPIFPVSSIFPIWFWTFFSVLAHVLLDIFNAYGTQILRPFSEKWVALNVINIFDPFLFISHSLAILLWILGYQPFYIFSSVFILTFFYILWRTISRVRLLSLLKQQYHLEGRVTLLPSIDWNTWNIIEESPKGYNIGVVRNKTLKWADFKEKTFHKAIEVAKKDSKVESFLYFTQYGIPEWKKTSFGYEVLFIDIRYRFKNHYPFIALVLLDDSFEIINSFLGWTYNPKHLNKTIQLLLKKN